MSEQLAYTISEAVTASRRSRSTLYLEIQAGRLKARKHGGRTLILASDLKAWLEALPELKSGAVAN